MYLIDNEFCGGAPFFAKQRRDGDESKKKQKTVTNNKTVLNNAIQHKSATQRPLNSIPPAGLIKNTITKRNLLFITVTHSRYFVTTLAERHPSLRSREGPGMSQQISRRGTLLCEAEKGRG